MCRRRDSFPCFHCFSLFFVYMPSFIGQRTSSRLFQYLWMGEGFSECDGIVIFLDFGTFCVMSIASLSPHSKISDKFCLLQLAPFDWLLELVMLALLDGCGDVGWRPYCHFWWAWYVLTWWTVWFCHDDCVWHYSLLPRDEQVLPSV